MGKNAMNKQSKQDRQDRIDQYISNLKTTIKDKGLSSVYDPIIDEYIETTTKTTKFTRNGLISRLMNPDLLNEIRKWKDAFDRFQGKEAVDKECVQTIKEDYLRRYQKAKNKSRKIENAGKYRIYLSKIMSPLQYLLGYENAVGSGMYLNDQQRTEFFREAVYRIRQADIPPAEQERIGGEEPDQIKCDDLPELVRATKKMESNNTLSARNALKAQEIVLELRETLEDISACDPDAVEEQRLKQWCGAIRKSLERNGWYPLYDTSTELEGQKQLRDSAFNIGNAVAIRVPGIFWLKDGKYELLEGFIGITTI